ncbi:uncharacterized protein LOC143059307 [Mytilus galloprovincialis]|uniref:uncharacterized protein LOC143059307 n=1 Tax=Mytilus galloprovincialis TaxID=29158 RepID=UPI003F7BE270
MASLVEISSVFLIILGILFPSSAAANEGNGTISSAGVYVKVLGQSGKIMMSRSENIESDENRVTVEMDEIKETDLSGNPVGAGGSPATKHSFNTFANQQFEYSEVGDGEFENISAKTFNFSATIDNGAKLVVDVYIFTENGTYSLNGENTTVSEGTVKFNIFIENWKFCGDTGVTCSKGSTTEIGKYVDFTIAIKGKGAAPQKKTGGGKKTTADEYDLGSGSSVIISDKVQYDGNGDWVPTPTGYPKLEQKGSKTLFVFRFDKFSKSVLYDPQVDLGKSPDTPETPTMEKETNAEGVWVKVLGKSGKIQVGNRQNPSQDPNRITIEFSELKEKKTDGSDIKDNKHRFNNFAVTDFQFSPPMDAEFMNLTVKKFTFNATLNEEGAMLETEVLIFREDGEITLGNETTMVKKGNMKFSTTIKDWKFCGQGGTTCSSSEVGEFLDFGMTIKGKGTPKKKPSSDKGNAEEYDLGEDSSVVMSRKVKYNTDDWTTMASGYPMVVTQGSKQIFYIRLNKFTGTAYYDPTVIYNTDGINGSPRNSVSLFACFLSVFICVFLF